VYSFARLAVDLALCALFKDKKY